MEDYLAIMTAPDLRQESDKFGYRRQNYYYHHGCQIDVSDQNKDMITSFFKKWTKNRNVTLKFTQEFQKSIEEKREEDKMHLKQ